MDPVERQRIREFHLKVSMLGAGMMIAASLAGAYILFIRRVHEVPGFMKILARWAHG